MGIESTIVDLSAPQPVLLRPGVISAAMLEEALGARIAAKQEDSPRYSGGLERHYAPRRRPGWCRRTSSTGRSRG